MVGLRVSQLVLALLAAPLLFPVLAGVLALADWWLGDGALLYALRFGTRKELIALLLEQWSASLPWLLPPALAAALAAGLLSGRRARLLPVPAALAAFAAWGMAGAGPAASAAAWVVGAVLWMAAVLLAQGMVRRAWGYADEG